MKNFSNYREILIRKTEIKPKYLWFNNFSSFLWQNRVFKNKTVLDFGCDIESPACAQFMEQNLSDKNYFGYDISETVTKWLKNKKYYYDFWNDNSKKFDVINASEVYEHLSKELRENFLKRSYYLLKPGGKLYIDIPYIANLNIIEFYRRDRTHEAVACEDEALYIEQFGFITQLFVGGYTIPYLSFFTNLYRIMTNLILGYKPFLVTFIIARKNVKKNN